MEHLKETSLKLKRDVVEMVYQTKDGHPSPSFSIADIITALYFDLMNVDPKKPNWDDRDRFVLSKGHACPILYAALAERGFFDRDELFTLRMFDTILQGHPYAPKTPGLDATTGSLGNGLSIALGMALSARIRNKGYHTYAIVGDGELGEGMIWEAAMAASHHRMDSLTLFIDNNNFQSGGSVEKVSGPYPIDEKFKAFGWHVQNIDGHDIEAIIAAVKEAHAIKGMPSVIVCKTVKGNGVSFMVGENSWHKRVYTDDEYHQAIVELGGTV